MTADRRHEPRVQAIDFISISEFHPETAKTSVTLGQTADLSRDGLRLELNHAIPVRTEISLTLGIGDAIVDLKGRVCSVQEVDATTSAMGIQFTEVPEEAREAIDVFLEQRSA